MLRAEKTKHGDTIGNPLFAEYTTEMLFVIEKQHDFLKQVNISNEAKFHVSNKVNNHNCRIRGSEIPNAVHEEEKTVQKSICYAH